MSTHARAKAAFETAFTLESLPRAEFCALAALHAHIMIPSLRLVIYFAVGTVFWVAAAALPELLTVAILFDVLLLFVAALDLLLSPRPRDFEITRLTDDKMNLGAANAVRLRAHSRANAPVVLWLRDEPPLGWPVAVSDAPPRNAAEATTKNTRNLARALLERAPQVGERETNAAVLPAIARLRVEVGPNGEAEGVYMVTPTRRGQWQFGALSARYTTRLGLWHRQFRHMSTQGEGQVRVYPDVSHVRRYELRLREGRLRDIGLHAARLRGQGTEFESLREYSSDDNYKDINWKASARRGSLVSTQYEIERDQTILIALDCGRMMTALAQFRDEKRGAQREAVLDGIANRFAAVDGGTSTRNGASRSTSNADSRAQTVSSPLSEPGATPLSKLDCAINATVLLAHVSASMGDSVGVLLFADSVLGFVPPRKGRLQTGLIIEALYAAQPSLVEPDYNAAYNYILSRRVRRALVVTFTDLIDPDASRELLQASGALRRHHNALCVSINNRDVMDLAGLMPQEATELYAKAMAQRMLTQRAAALEGLRRQGVGILDVDASQLTIATVNRYLDMKSRAAM